MNPIGWLAVGALIGWGTGLLMRTPESLWIKILVGVAGACVAGWLFSLARALDAVDLNVPDAAGFVVSGLGALALLAIARVPRRGRERRSQTRPLKGWP